MKALLSVRPMCTWPRTIPPHSTWHRQARRPGSHGLHNLRFLSQHNDSSRTTQDSCLQKHRCRARCSTTQQGDVPALTFLIATMCPVVLSFALYTVANYGERETRVSTSAGRPAAPSRHPRTLSRTAQPAPPLRGPQQPLTCPSPRKSSFS